MANNFAQMEDNLLIENENITKLYELFSSLDPDPELATNAIVSQLLDTQGHQERVKQSWTKEWNYLTTDTAPWEKSVHKTEKNERISTLSEKFVMIQTNVSKDQPVIRQRNQSQSLLNFAIPQGVLEQMQFNTDEEVPAFQTETVLYSMKYEYTGTFSLFHDKISITGLEGNRHDIMLDNIQFMMPRKICHRPTAIEIFTYNGESCLISFSKVTAQEVVTRINSQHLVHSIGTPYKITKQWLHRKLTNFEYIVYVNMFSGRSFNNASMYPIFPWIIDDYSSEYIDLNNPRIYRDLSQPICRVRDATEPFKRAHLTLSLIHI